MAGSLLKNPFTHKTYTIPLFKKSPRILTSLIYKTNNWLLYSNWGMDLPIKMNENIIVDAHYI